MAIKNIVDNQIYKMVRKRIEKGAKMDHLIYAGFFLNYEKDNCEAHFINKDGKQFKNNLIISENSELAEVLLKNLQSKIKSLKKVNAINYELHYHDNGNFKGIKYEIFGIDQTNEKTLIKS